MNKRELQAVAAMVAEWEWQGGGSSSEAAARYSCGREVIQTLRIPDDELSFARTYEVFRKMGDVGDDALFDALDDMVEREGYDAVVQAIEKNGFDGLRAALEAALRGEAS